jgi:hypothetical protein
MDQLARETTAPARPEWSLIVAVNDPRVLHDTLLRSPDIDRRCEIITETGHASAGQAYNAGLAQATREIQVFAHQDVYLPAGWMDSLLESIARLEKVDPAWGVLGVFGVTWMLEKKGYVYSTGLQSVVGEPFRGIYEAISLDEMVLIVRRSAGLTFDEQLPGFHLYGTDICLEARRRGLRSYILPVFCIHNSNGIQRFPAAFWTGYRYLRCKWRDQLPLHTCCTSITRLGWPMVRRRLRDTLYDRFSPRGVGTRCADPDTLYQSLLASGQHGLKA